MMSQSESDNQHCIHFLGQCRQKKGASSLVFYFFPHEMAPGKGQITGELSHGQEASDKRLLLPFYGPRALGVRRREGVGVEKY